jgi:inorganic pyrophosphatase
MAGRNLITLPTFAEQSNRTILNAVVESPRGSRVKLKYNPDLDVFALSYVLARGSTFPCEFGFIPSTLGDDGDPLDILILMDAATCTGCVISARALGVIEAEQTQDRKTFRNDRIIAVTIAEHERAGLRSLDEIAPALLDEIEHFFVSYNQMRGREFKPRCRAGLGTVSKLLERGIARFAKQQSAHRR